MVGADDEGNVRNGQLLRHFDFQLVYPTQPWKSANYNLYLQRDMWVSVAVREAEAKTEAKAEAKAEE